MNLIKAFILILLAGMALIPFLKGKRKDGLGKVHFPIAGSKQTIAAVSNIRPAPARLHRSVGRSERPAE
jgi:hypothetical protein